MLCAIIVFAAGRWSYTLSSPNCAALAIALLLPVLWWQWSGGSNEARRPRWQFALALCVEAALCFLLAKTLSRGGFVAALAGLVFFHALSARGAVAKRKVVWLALVMRVALYFGLAFAGGLYARGNPAYVAQDRSILNRFDVWQGACALIAYNPGAGWGFANSGKMYVNWIQDNSSVHVYRGVMNLFLQLAVELGLPLALTMLAAALTIIAWPWFQARSSDLENAASSAVLIWLVANMFSTLGEDWEVYVLIIGWVILWGSRLPSFPFKWVAPVSTGAVAAVLFGIAVYVAGQYQKPPIAIRELHGKGVAVAKSVPEEAADVYLDLQVVGRVPGQRLRRVLASDAKELRVWNEDPAPAERAAIGVFFGRTCRLEAINGYERVVLVNPPGAPCGEAFGARRVALILSANGDAAHGWLELAREKGWSVLLVGGSYPYLEEAHDVAWYAAIAS